MRYAILSGLLASAWLPFSTAFAQSDSTSMELDLLRAPTSPGSVLLEFNESDVERPTTPTAFMFSLRQATNDFSALPKNWAVDLAPGVLLNPSVSARQLIGLARGKDSLRYGQRVLQSSVLSLATRNLGAMDDSTGASPGDPQLAIGFKLSLWEGHPSEETVGQFQKLDSAMTCYVLRLHRKVDDMLKADREYAFLDSAARANAARQGTVTDTIELMVTQLGGVAEPGPRRLIEEALADARAELMMVKFNKTEYARQREKRTGELRQIMHLEESADSLRLRTEAQAVLKAAEDFKVKREGFKLDVAGGLVLDFVDRDAGNSRVARAGLWTTFGWETEDDVAFLLFARWLANPDKAYLGEGDTIRFADYADIDLGARLLLEPNNGRFAFSAEAIYRQPQESIGLDPTWRLVANTSYDLGDNRRLAFSFGKNYDGSIEKKGNLVLALNFLMGFGDKKPIK